MSAAETKPQDTHAIVEQGYDIVADKYFAWATPRSTATRNAHLDALLTQLPPGAHVLELGCASGIPSTKTMLDRGFAVTGVVRALPPPSGRAGRDRRSHMLFNLHVAAGDVWRDDWMGARMFSSGRGVEGNRGMMRAVGGVRVLVDEVVVVVVGRIEERFHWVLAVEERDG